MTDPSTPVPAYNGRTVFGHPLGLVTCFSVEFFERFTYYGMRSMLVLFLSASMVGQNPGFGLDGATAGAVYALFTGGAYLLAIPGGWLADRVIGHRKAIFVGGLLIAAGNFILAIPATQTVFYSGIFVMVLGIGLLKPNVSTVVGTMYQGMPGARRDAGFSFFYMGINLGATVGPIIASGIGEKVNWHRGFFICGVATLLGTLFFLFSQRWLGNAGLPPTDVPAAERKRTWTMLIGIAVGAAVLAVALFAREHPPTEHQLALGLFARAMSSRVVGIRKILFAYLPFFKLD